MKLLRVSAAGAIEMCGLWFSGFEVEGDGHGEVGGGIGSAVPQG